MKEPKFQNSGTQLASIDIRTSIVFSFVSEGEEIIHQLLTWFNNERHIVAKLQSN